MAAGLWILIPLGVVMNAFFRARPSFRSLRRDDCSGDEEVGVPLGMDRITPKPFMEAVAFGRFDLRVEDEDDDEEDETGEDAEDDEEEDDEDTNEDEGYSE
jgi:hypothetical protein